MKVEDAGSNWCVVVEPGDALEGCDQCELSAVLWFARNGEHAPLSRAAAAKGNHFHYNHDLSYLYGQA